MKYHVHFKENSTEDEHYKIALNKLPKRDNGNINL